MITIYKVRQKGILPFLIRLFYTLRFFKKCKYNHVMIKSKGYFIELDLFYGGIHIFNEAILNDEWTIQECKSYKVNDLMTSRDFKYSNLANLRYVLISIPILGKFIKKMWKPSQKNLNCCGYIAMITGNDKYFNYHPNDFR